MSAADGHADEQLDREMMALALARAREGLEAGGVPVGAVLAEGATVLGKGHNERVQIIGIHRCIDALHLCELQVRGAIRNVFGLVTVQVEGADALG